VAERDLAAGVAVTFVVAVVAVAVLFVVTIGTGPAALFIITMLPIMKAIVSPGASVCPIAHVVCCRGVVPTPQLSA